MESPLRILTSHVSFVRFQTMEICPEFYKIASPSSPWQLAVRMSHIGKTSYWFEYVTCCQKTGKQLIRCLLQLVQVDLETRRPIPLPVEGLEMYRRAATASPPPRFIFPNTRPASDRIFKTSIKATPSETDRNHHANHAAYFKYCIDGASFSRHARRCSRSFH